MKRERIAWVTGAGGLIGSHIVRHATQATLPFHVRALTRQDIDLLDFAALRHSFHHDQPGCVIHCAAISQSPACQREPELAWKTNFESTRELCELCQDIPLLFFSTDLVFDGRKGNYTETDSVNPLSVYAETKVAAEVTVLANPLHLVIRTSLNGGPSPSGDRGFDEQLCRAFSEGQVLKLFVDEFRTPIAASETARAAWELLVQQRSGLFHVAGPERVSRWEIGCRIARRCPDWQSAMEPSSLTSYCGAPRSPDTSLDSSRVNSLMSRSLEPFSWHDSTRS